MSASVSGPRPHSTLNDSHELAELDCPAPAIITATIATGLVLVLSQFAPQILTLLEIALRIVMSTR